MPKIDLSNKLWQWLALLLMAFIWGTSFILMKKGLQSYDYMQVAAFRIFFSFIILIPIFIKRIRKLTRQNTLYIILSGLCGIFFPAFLFTKAQTQISSSLAGMLNSLTPFFTLMIGIVVFKTKPGRNQYVGIFLGLIGAFGLVGNGNLSEVLSGFNFYAIYVLLATFGYGLNVNLIKAKLNGLSGIDITALSFMFIGVPAGLYLLFSDFSEAAQTPDYLLNLFFVFLLALFGSVLALFMFNSLIQHTSAIFAASVTYIIPIFAIFWGVIDGERVTVLHMVSIAIVLLGIWILNKRKRRKVS